MLTQLHTYVILLCKTMKCQNKIIMLHRLGTMHARTEQNYSKKALQAFFISYLHYHFENEIQLNARREESEFILAEEHHVSRKKRLYG